MPPTYSQALQALKKDEFKEWDTPQQIRSLRLHDPSPPHNSVLHWAISANVFCRIPSTLITLETLLIKNQNGITCLHYVAGKGLLHEIAQPTLSEALLLTSDGNPNGDTPLHYAAAHRQLRSVPKAFLTAKSLHTPNLQRWTPFLWAANTGHLDDIPCPLLTPQAILKPLDPHDPESTALHWALFGNRLSEIPHGILPLHTLETLLKEPRFTQKENLKIWLESEKRYQKKRTVQDAVEKAHHPAI